MAVYQAFIGTCANHYEKLVLALGVEKRRPVSRSQLPIILEKVAVEVFDQLLFENARNQIKWTRTTLVYL